jgi:hypothetical protein
MDSLQDCAACVEPLAVLSRFRLDFHACLTARADELSELADAVLCADGPVRTLAGLSLASEHRRGHGALYDAVNHDRISIGRLRQSLAGLPLPRAPDGRLVLAARGRSPGCGRSTKDRWRLPHRRLVSTAKFLGSGPFFRKWARANKNLAVDKVHGQVTRLLGGPSAGWMQGDSEDTDAPGRVLYHGQDISPGCRRSGRR